MPDGAVLANTAALIMLRRKLFELIQANGGISKATVENLLALLDERRGWQLDGDDLSRCKFCLRTILYRMRRDWAKTGRHKQRYTLQHAVPGPGPWFDRELRTALKEKEVAFKRMKRNMSEESVGSCQNKRRNFENLSDQKYNDYLVGLTDELKLNPKRFW